MSWHVVHLADVAATQWRNGGGLTRELASGPAGADWQWRLSVAEVAADGPFSRFEGVTRWFAVLQGAGVVLRVQTPSDTATPGATTHRLTVHDAPLCFDGAAATDCQLIDGPTQDFNLMLRHACLPARMVRVHANAEELVHASKFVAVYAISTRASVRFNAEELYVPPATLVWRHVTKAATVRIACEHALWMEWSA
ncbi:MAG: HutD family protein [Burkholderiales bacterium]|nr:HutD family protein [Burkholderiales bacterium]